VNPADLHAALVTRLKALQPTNPNLAVFDGDITTTPPAANDGRVWPYAVVWGTPGYTPDEARSITADAAGELAWACPVTVAAGDPLWCLRAAHLIRTHLDGWRIDPDHVLVEQPGTPPLTRDADVQPPRWFVAFTFRTGPTL